MLILLCQQLRGIDREVDRDDRIIAFDWFAFHARMFENVVAIKINILIVLARPTMKIVD